MDTSSISYQYYKSNNINSITQDDLFTSNTLYSNTESQNVSLSTFPKTQNVLNHSNNNSYNAITTHDHSFIHQSSSQTQGADFNQFNFFNNLTNHKSFSNDTKDSMKENQIYFQHRNFSLELTNNSELIKDIPCAMDKCEFPSSDVIPSSTNSISHEKALITYEQNKNKIYADSSLKSTTVRTNPSLSSRAHSSNGLSSKRVVDLMKDTELIPPTGIISPVPKLGYITKKLNCNPNIMKCTMNCIPSNEEILNKTHLPLALLIHPFKDISNLEVTKCGKIVRCRTSSCRAYLNPFVTLLNKNRWKCNFCQSLNEFSNDFLYNESNEIYETQKRVELKFSTLEYVVQMEYCKKTSQVPVYVFLIDISANAISSLYSNTMIRILNTIDELLEQLPGHQCAKLGIIGYDNYIHLYSINEKKCQEIIISDISSFIEVPSGLSNILVPIHIYKDQIRELLSNLLDNIDIDVSTQALSSENSHSCLGSAILCAKDLIGSYGGRITIFNASRPSVGEGILTVRNRKKYTKSFPISPNKEFYKTLSLECAEIQIGIDLFQLGRLPCDLASLSIISRYCGGSLFYYPDLTVSSSINVKENIIENNDSGIFEITRLLYDLNRYLTRNIGFDALLRVRYSSGLSVQSFHGNFFARTCDLFALVNVNPDTGATVRFKISNSLVYSNLVFFQSALLYTSCMGERRIRVHTLAVPVSSQISNVFSMADHQAVAGFLSKSVCDRLQSDGKILECREALVNAVVDPCTAFGVLCLKSKSNHHSLSFPYHLRLLPFYVWGILQSKCLSPTQKDPDQSVAILDSWRNQPLSYLLVDLCPTLFNLTSVAFLTCKQKEYVYEILECTTESLSQSVDADCNWNFNTNLESTSSYYSENESSSSWDSETSSGISGYDSKCDRFLNDLENSKTSENDSSKNSENLWYPEQIYPCRQSLSKSSVSLLNTSRGLLFIMSGDTPYQFFQQVFGVDSFSEMPTNGIVQLPQLTNAASFHLNRFIRNLQKERPIGSQLFVVTNDIQMSFVKNSIIQSHLIDDDGSGTSSYHRFLKYIHRKVIS